MTKFKIRNEEQKLTEKDHELEVWLAHENGTIILKGHDGVITRNILFINNEGYLTCNWSCNLRGLKCNDVGEIIVEKD